MLGPGVPRPSRHRCGKRVRRRLLAQKVRALFEATVGAPTATPPRDPGPRQGGVRVAPTTGCRSLVAAPCYGYRTATGSQEVTPAPRSPDPADSEDPKTAASTKEDRHPPNPAWHLVALDPVPVVDYSAAQVSIVTTFVYF